MLGMGSSMDDAISAPWVIDGPINGELFLPYLEKVLAPTLAKGEVVILDNLGSHKGKSARDVIRIRGAYLLFLPPRIPITNTSAARSSSSTGWCSIARR